MVSRYDHFPPPSPQPTSKRENPSLSDPKNARQSRSKTLTGEPVPPPLPTEALEAATASLSVDAQKRAAKDAQKKTAQAAKAEAKHADKVANSIVTIKRIERNKRKYVTSVSGLEAFDLDLKKVCLPQPARL